MPVAEMLKRLGSSEVSEWIAELTVLRPEDEKAAMDRAREEARQ